jgi:hypothetical protein
LSSQNVTSCTLFHGTLYGIDDICHPKYQHMCVVAGCSGNIAMPALHSNMLLFAAEGNVMLNDLVSTTAGTAVLYSSMLVYLALGMTTTQYALRQSLDAVFFGEGAGFTWRRHVSAWGCQTANGCEPAGQLAQQQPTCNIVRKASVCISHLCIAHGLASVSYM